MTPLSCFTMPTPVGELSVLIEDGVVVSAGFAAVEALASRIGRPRPSPADIFTLAQTPQDSVGTTDEGSLAMHLRAWLAGDVAALDSVPTRQTGTPFQHDVWAALRTIRPGTAITYAELASRAGRPAAARAVGSACGANNLAPFVPCHRVVPSSGGAGGYAWGVGAKEWLLRHEAGQATGL